ncbi:hypothetical protein, partial [Salinivibrio kushneri]
MAKNYIDYSNCWHQISALLEMARSPTTLHHSNVYTFEQHQEALALGKFLAESSLTTPPLTKENVSKLLNGQLKWERDGTFISIKSDVTVEFLERAGLIIFEADWITITCNLDTDITDSVHKSLHGIIDTLLSLRGISFGDNGYKKPELKNRNSLWSSKPEYKYISNEKIEKREDGYVYSGNEFHITPLVSSYIWRALLEVKTSYSEAFSSWILIMRATHTIAVPIVKALVSNIEWDIFNSELNSHLQNIVKPPNPYLNFYYNSNFVSCAINYIPTIHIGSSTGSERNQSRTIKNKNDILKKSDLEGKESHIKNDFQCIDDSMNHKLNDIEIGDFYRRVIHFYLNEKVFISSNHVTIYPEA